MAKITVNSNGVTIENSDGVVHLGKGDIIEGTTVFSGDGVTIVNGDNPGGISKTFGGKKGRK